MMKQKVSECKNCHGTICYDLDNECFVFDHSTDCLCEVDFNHSMFPEWLRKDIGI